MSCCYYRNSGCTNTPKNKSKELSEKLNHISAYSEKSTYEQAQEKLSKLNDLVFTDIPTDLNNGFCGKIISAMQEKAFINHYKPYFQEVYSLLKKLEAFNITPSETISKFTSDFGAINRLVKQHNDSVITFLLDAHKEFFDHCLKYPLDKQQRRSIIQRKIIVWWLVVRVVAKHLLSSVRLNILPKSKV